MKNAFGNEHENIGGFSIHDPRNDTEFSRLHTRASNKKAARAEKSMAPDRFANSGREDFFSSREKEKIVCYACFVNAGSLNLR